MPTKPGMKQKPAGKALPARDKNTAKPLLKNEPAKNKKLPISQIAKGRR